jgi:hypothetical protein
MYRRDFLKTLALGSVALSPLGHAWANYATQTSELVIGKRTLDVNGKAASVFGLTDKAGNAGLVLNAPSDFDVLLRNESYEETLIHWHGLTPPWIWTACRVIRLRRFGLRRDDPTSFPCREAAPTGCMLTLYRSRAYSRHR